MRAEKVIRSASVGFNILSCIKMKVVALFVLYNSFSLYKAGHLIFKKFIGRLRYESP